MTITKIIIALMFFVVASLSVLSIVFDMYSARGYDIDLSDDPKTAFLSELQDTAEESNSNILSTNEQMWNTTIGQSGADIQSGSITEGDLMRSAWYSLSNVKNYVNSGYTMLEGFFSLLSLGTTSPLFGFIVGSILLTITTMIISSVLNKEL